MEAGGRNPHVGAGDEAVSAPWWEGPLLAFDTETTGPEPTEARLVSAAVDLFGLGDTEPTESLRLIVNPGVPIPEGASAVHGITDDIAQRDGIDPKVAVSKVMHALYDAFSRRIPVVAYNAAYDFTVIAREAQRHLGATFKISGPVIDPFVLDKAVDRYRRGQRTLTVTAEHYGIDLTNAHDATADAYAAVMVCRAVGQQYARTLPTYLGDLWRYQRQQRREQAASLQAHYARTGKTNDDGSPITVDPSWPIREDQ